MKLHLNIQIFFWKDTKISKDIEKNKEICFSFDI
jgi:general stress protein 26